MNSRADEQEARNPKEVGAARRIRGELAQGERALDCEALATKGPARRPDGRARKSTIPYLGRSRLTLEKATPVERPNGARSQQRP